MIPKPLFTKVIIPLKAFLGNTVVESAKYTNINELKHLKDVIGFYGDKVIFPETTT